MVSNEYYNVYSYNTNFIKGGVTELPTGMSILRYSDVIMRLGDTLFDKNYNLYLIDIKNINKVYLHSLRAFITWLCFWSIIGILSLLKCIRNIDRIERFFPMMILFLISFMIFMVSLITFFCGVNCYGIEIYDYNLRNKVNRYIKYLLIAISIIAIYTLI
jgi:hypothetical protein